MENRELLELREHNFFRACAPDETPDFVPVLANPDTAVLYESGKTVRQAWDGSDQEAAEALAAFYGKLPCDSTLGATISYSPDVLDALGDAAQYVISPDGYTVEHLQKPPMREDEYPQLIEDLDGFAKNTLLPRRFPQLFQGDAEEVKKTIRTIFDGNARMYGSLTEANAEVVAEKYGVYTPPIMGLSTTPPDMMFDVFRGFKGTLLDIRRHKDAFKAACDVLWEQRIGKQTDFFGEVIPFVFSMYAAHIVPYLSPKDFETLYWPYEKVIIENLAKNQDRLITFCEGKWQRFLDYYKDVPKNSVLMLVDDDDIIEFSEAIGEYQIVGGGAKSINLKYMQKSEIESYTKNIIDKCAGTGSFIFTADKSFSCPGDVSEGMVEAYRVAAEYGKY